MNEDEQGPIGPGWEQQEWLLEELHELQREINHGE